MSKSLQVLEYHRGVGSSLLEMLKFKIPELLLQGNLYPLPDPWITFSIREGRPGLCLAPWNGGPPMSGTHQTKTNLGNQPNMQPAL